MILLLALSAQSQANTRGSEWVMGYTELMMLSGQQRLNYLLELRRILIDFEAQAALSEAAISQRSNPERKVILDLLISKAFAAESITCPPGYTPVNTIEGAMIVQKCALSKVRQCPNGMKIHTIYYSSPPLFDCVPDDNKDESKLGSSDKTNDGSASRTSPSTDDSKDLPNNCKSLVPQCAGREQYRGEFYTKPRPCLYAGNISRYRGGKPATGACVPKVKFDIDLGTNPSQCKPGTVLCNPLVFGLKEGPPGKSLICVSLGPEATEECDKASNNSKSSEI